MRSIAIYDLFAAKNGEINADLAKNRSRCPLATCLRRARKSFGGAVVGE